MKQKQSNNRNRKWLIIVGIAIVALVLFYFVGRIVGNQLLKAPEKVGNEFVYDVQQNNPEAAFKLYPSADHVETETILAQSLASYSPHLQGIAKVTGGLKQASGTNPEAVLIYSISNNGQTTYLKVLLAQFTTNDVSQWYIIGYHGSNSHPALNFNLND